MSDAVHETVSGTVFLLESGGRRGFARGRWSNRIGVLLNIEDYQKLLADVEELESIRAFDEAKASGEKPIPFERAVAEIEARQK